MVSPRVYFFHRNKISSASPRLFTNILTNILHERWLKSVQNFPACGNCDVYLSKFYIIDYYHYFYKIWYQTSWWQPVLQFLKLLWKLFGKWNVLLEKDQFLSLVLKLFLNSKFSTKLSPQFNSRNTSGR